MPKSTRKHTPPKHTLMAFVTPRSPYLWLLWHRLWLLWHHPSSKIAADGTKNADFGGFSSLNITTVVVCISPPGTGGGRGVGTRARSNVIFSLTNFRFFLYGCRNDFYKLVRRTCRFTLPCPYPLKISPRMHQNKPTLGKGHERIWECILGLIKAISVNVWIYYLSGFSDLQRFSVQILVN